MFKLKSLTTLKRQRDGRAPKNERETECEREREQRNGSTQHGPIKYLGVKGRAEAEEEAEAEQTKTNKAKKQTNPEDAFALASSRDSRYNLDNLYLNIVVSTQALTDRCFDLESGIVSVRYFHYPPPLLLSRSHSNQNKYGRNKTLKQRK